MKLQNFKKLQDHVINDAQQQTLKGGANIIIFVDIMM